MSSVLKESFRGRLVPAAVEGSGIVEVILVGVCVRLEEVESCWV